MPYVRTRLGRWYYEEHGRAAATNGTGKEAPTVVMLHGLLFDGSMWDAQVPELARLGRVLVFDGPGHGRSEVPPPFSLEDHARAMIDAMDVLGVGKALPIGLSWGGMLAMRLAIGHPLRVAAMALLDTSADAETRANRIKYRAMASFSRRAGLPYGFMRRAIAPILFGARSLAARPELFDRWASALVGFPREGLARAARAVVIDRPSITRDLRAVSVPTLVVCGEEDRATPPFRSRTIAAQVPRASLKVIPGVGHSSVVEQPDAVNAVLVPFVRDQLG